MADNPLTLITAANQMPDIMMQGIVEQFGNLNALVREIPLDFSDNPTRYDFQRERFIADAGWRKFMDDVDQTHSELEDVSEKLFPLATKIPLDNQYRKGNNNNLPRTQINGAIKGMSSKLTRSFFYGDNSLGNEPDGLKIRTTALSQEISLNASGLNVLGSATNAKSFINKLIDANAYVDEPSNPANGRKVFFMDEEVINTLTQAILLSGYVQMGRINDLSETGMITAFDGKPIIPVPRDKDGNRILGFVEDSTDGSSTDDCASIYLCNLSTEDGVHFVTTSDENDILNPTLKEYTTGGVDYLHFEIAMGFAVRKARSIVRIKDIKNT